MSYTRAQTEMMRLQVLKLGRANARTFDRTLPAARMVEFRCGGAGHLLAVIYETPSGPLFVSTADAFTDSAEERREVVSYIKRRRAKAVAPDDRASLRSPGWDPSPRLPLIDEAFVDEPARTSCRCGVGPQIPRAAMLACLALPPASPRVIGVAPKGLAGPGGTLFFEF